MTTLHEIPIGVRRLPHGEGLELPRYHSPLAAGMDLRAAVPEDAPRTLRAGERALIPTGLTIALPPGHEGQIRPRSGLALHHGVTVLNAPGTIDADYRGELQALLVNLGEADFTITRGMRIAQLVVASVSRGVWREMTPSEVSANERGEGGFGSTGLGTAARDNAACNEKVARWKSHPPHPPHITNGENDASFTQRPPKDSAKRAGGRAKNMGGFGGVSPPKSTRTSVHNVGWAGKSKGGRH